jgi:hypothetical protein
VDGVHDVDSRREEKKKKQKVAAFDLVRCLFLSLASVSMSSSILVSKDG